MCFIAYAGVIRGAVAFGLVLRIENDVEHRSVIVTTSLAIVCFTTVFLGSTVATMQRCLFGKLDTGKKIEDLGHGLHDANESHHEEFQHPNFEDVAAGGDEVTPTVTAGTPNQKMSRKQSCLRWFKHKDATVIKPFFIYNYDKSMHKRTRQYFDMFMKEGKKIEKIYTVGGESRKSVSGDKSLSAQKSNDPSPKPVFQNIQADADALLAKNPYA